MACDSESSVEFKVVEDVVLGTVKSGQCVLDPFPVLLTYCLVEIEGGVVWLVEWIAEAGSDERGSFQRREAF